MADKTTTLKTKTNDNVYPNVIGENRDNAIVDSAHIKHTLTAEHKINFRIDDNVSNLIFNSLQKPKGLTKTELVGVGTNGQENIEIGDNLTLANGKLSASGGGGGSIPVVEGTITSENIFALNETPTGDYFLAHLLYAGFVYVNSLMTKTTVTFPDGTNSIFYIGLIVLNGVPFLAYSGASEDGNSINNVMKQICFMNNPYQSNGIIYFTNGGFDSLEFPSDSSTSTYVLKAVNGTVQWVKES